MSLPAGPSQLASYSVVEKILALLAAFVPVQNVAGTTPE